MFIICVFFVFKNNIIIGISCRVFVFFFKFFSFLSNISCFLPVLNHTSILRILRIWLFVLSIGLSSFVCLGFTSRVCVYACKCKYVYVGGVVYSSMGSTRLASFVGFTCVPEYRAIRCTCPSPRAAAEPRRRRWRTAIRSSLACLFGDREWSALEIRLDSTENIKSDWQRSQLFLRLFWAFKNAKILFVPQFKNVVGQCA